MKEVKYLSPSSISTWLKSPEEFVLKYMVGGIPRIEQTLPMSIGSAFDALVKSRLIRDLGLGGSSFEELFEAQVEVQHRDAALAHGQTCFAAYDYSSLMGVLRGATEVRVEDVVTREFGVGDPPLTLLGKPDLFAIFDSFDFVLDWKVNGIMSSASPMAGHMKHRDFMPGYIEEVCYNLIQSISPEWSRQTCIYGWLCSGEATRTLMIAIDQIHHRNGIVGTANHRNLLTCEYQAALMAEIQSIWDVIHSDHILRHMSQAESVARVRMLTAQADAYTPPDGGVGVKEQWLADLRKHRNY